MHPSLEHLAGWINTLGAGIALDDLDRDGLPDDVVWVDPRFDSVFVGPVPGTGDRYEPFALDPAPNPPDERTTAPMGCVPCDVNEDGLEDLLDKVSQMSPADRELAERVHVAITGAAPDLTPKTWYGMPAYANADGKVVVFFQDSGKFNYRYSTLGFQDTANLDDGDLWPVSYALRQWSPEVEKQVVELVQAAVS